jgi:hypothetical protein
MKELLDPNELLMPKVAIHWIYSNLKYCSRYSFQNERTLKNKIGQNLRRNVQRIQESYRFNDVLEYAIRQYPELESVKKYPEVAIGNFSINGMFQLKARLDGIGYSVPSEHKDCPALMGELTRELHFLKKELLEREAIIEQWRPIVEQHIKRQQKGRETGGKWSEKNGGHGRSKL